MTRAHSSPPHHAHSRTRATAVVGATAACACAIGALLVACADLFHATDDLKTACDLDAGDDACAVAIDAPIESDAADATPDASIDFCAWDSSRARAAAESACVLLGSCETPMGKQRFGECMVHALLAYDCQINPNRKVRGATHDFWACMSAAASCDDVKSCTFPVRDKCPQEKGLTCGVSAVNRATRVDCPGVLDAIPKTENCAAWGQTCSAAACAGDRTGTACTSSGCFGTELHECGDGGSNAGVDCLAFGAGKCETNAGVAGCLGEGQRCAAPSTQVNCVDGGPIAVGCPSSAAEFVDCKALTLGQRSCDGQASINALLSVANACFGADTCDAGESCTGSGIASCYRGVTYTVQCAAGCALIDTADGKRAACNR